MEENRTYCGKTLEQMDSILDIMCDIEDRDYWTDEEQAALDIAIQCITTVMNRMSEDRPIEFE